MRVLQSPEVYGEEISTVRVRRHVGTYVDIVIPFRGDRFDVREALVEPLRFRRTHRMPRNCTNLNVVAHILLSDLGFLRRGIRIGCHIPPLARPQEAGEGFLRLDLINAVEDVDQRTEKGLVSNGSISSRNCDGEVCVRYLTSKANDGGEKECDLPRYRRAYRPGHGVQTQT